MGDMDVTVGNGKLNYFDGTTASPMVTESGTATLINKSIDGDDNTITNIPYSGLPANVATTDTAQTFTNKTINANNNSISEIANINISTVASIAYTKLNLANSIVNADVNSAAAITYSKLNLSNTIVNADVNSAAAIAYSKLNLFSSVVDTDISNVANIARFKLAAGSASQVVINDGSGIMTTEAVLAKVRGGTGADNTGVTFPSTGTITTNAGVQTLTNKTIVGSANSISGISNTMITSLGASNNQVLTADGSGNTTWQTPSAGGSGTVRNHLLNGGFELWQRGTTAVFTNNTQGYVADRWYAKNTLGTGSQITYQQTTSAPSLLSTSKYVATLQVASSPSSIATANGMELYQVLENRDSLPFYNQTASFGVKIQAISNVTQVGLQFMYSTSESKVTSTIGSEVLVTVNSSTFTQCDLNGQAIGTAMTANGVIGVRIRPTAVSSGNVSDAFNGILVGEAIMNLGATVGTFQRNGSCFAEEVENCKRFYEKSYNITTNPGTSTYDSIYAMLFVSASIPNTAQIVSVNLAAEKRTAPTVVIYGIGGTIGKISNFLTSSDITIGSGVTVRGNKVFTIANASGVTISLTSTDGICLHYVADAEI